MAKALRSSKFTLSAEAVIADYRLAYSSRRASVIGRAEVLRGNATFGIFGDGKEIASIAMAQACRPGDWRAGYYRDQTFIGATRMSNVRAFFAQLYGNASLEADPASGGRQMGNHFATRFLDDRGEFERSVDMPNSSADVSNVAGWMPRLVGLAYASTLYRDNPQLKDAQDGFSVNGNEVAFGTIGDAATSEGLFWEAINAAGVLQIPMAMSVWDDGYGISVPITTETTKASISDVLRGFSPDDRPGIASESQLEGWEAADKEAVEAARDLAWEAFQSPIRAERERAVAILRRVDMPEVAEITNSLDEAVKVTRSLIMSSAKRALHQLRGLEAPARDELAKFVRDYGRENDERYNSHLYSSSPDSPLNVPLVGAAYSDQSPTRDCRQVLVRNFDANFARDPRIFVIGEDIGRIC